MTGIDNDHEEEVSDGDSTDVDGFGDAGEAEDPGLLVRPSKGKLKNGDSNNVSECKVFVDDFGDAAEFEDLGLQCKDETKARKNHARRQLQHLENEIVDIDRIIDREVPFAAIDQVMCMKYVKTRRIYGKRNNKNKKRKVVRVDFGHFVGRTNGRTERLQDDWVKENISPKFSEYLKSNAGVECELPPGDVRSNEKIGGVTSAKTDAPKCKFQQGEYRTCVFSSFASCVHHLGHVDLGCRIQLLAKKLSGHVNSLQNLKKAVDVGMGKPINIRKYKTGRLNLLDKNQQVETDGQCHPTVVVLQGEDAGIEHAVTVYGDWVFDSNAEFAQPLTRKTLDWCVNGKFLKVHQAVRYFLPKAKVTKKGSKNKLTNGERHH